MPRYNRLVIDGTLATGAERWSCGINFTADAITPSADNLADWAEAVLESLRPTTGTPATVKGYLSTSGTITRVRAYTHPDLGEPADRAGVSTGAAIAGSGTANMPPQCSLVVTLLTGVAGRSGRGRFYWPHVGGSVTSAGKSSLVSGTTASAWADLLSNWGTLLPSADITVAVASETQGTITPVITASVGDVVDTQRRRRDGLVEARFVGSIV